MANYTLYISSLLMTYIHVSALWIKRYQSIMSIIWINGCFSSILNHGLTSNVAKHYDRVSMFISFFFDLSIILELDIHFSAGVLIYLAACSYLISKFMLSSKLKTMLHLYSHCLITLCHLVELDALTKKVANYD